MLQPASALGTSCARTLPESAVPPHVAARLLGEAGEGPVSGYMYDVAVAAERARALRAALPSWATLLFALKANGFRPIVEALAVGGVDGLEVASTREVRLAREVLGGRGTVAASGPAKHPRLLADLLTAGVDVVHAESVLELRRISGAARADGLKVRVALRVNPARVAVTGSLEMAGRSSAFGIAESEVPDAIRLAQRLPGIDLVGFHVHAVCGNRDASTHAAYVRWCLDWSIATAHAHGVDLRWLDVGGGLGVAYDEVEPLDLTILAEELGRLTPPAGVEVVFEPGRWLAADAGWYASTVIDVKGSFGETFVVVRGGIGGFALPCTEDFPFPVAVLPVADWPEPVPRPEVRGRRVTVSGELCTPEDVLVRDVHVERVRAGDLVVIPKAGAYGWEFGLHEFLGHPPPTRSVVHATSDPSRSRRTLEVTP